MVGKVTLEQVCLRVLEFLSAIAPLIISYRSYGLRWTPKYILGFQLGLLFWSG